MTIKTYNIHKILLKRFGKQHWWPVISKNRKEKKLEIAIGAILTQNTSWKNVEKVIKNLIDNNVFDKKSLNKIPEEKLALLIKSSGYYKQKAKKIKAFINFLESKKKITRENLLEIYGIGEETADSILLYAYKKPFFVVDAYTKRIFSRLTGKNFKNYGEWQKFFHDNLPRDEKIFNEFHALLVKLGKEFCKSRPFCKECPLNEVCKRKI